jgi:hypothetical protein
MGIACSMNVEEEKEKEEEEEEEEENAYKILVGKRPLGRPRRR